MKPVHQTRFGERGNCAQAAVASLLEVPLHEVPDLSTDSAWFRTLQEYLGHFGLIAVEHRPATPIVCAQDGLLALLSGISPRGYRHMVVGRLGHSGWEIAHDPHPEGGGLDPITYALLICADDPARIRRHFPAPEAA